GYYLYQQFVPGTKLSRPIRAWDGRKPPDSDVLNLISRAGTDVAPRPDGKRCKSWLGRGSRRVLPMYPMWELPMKQISDAPSILRSLEFSAPREFAVKLGRAWLRIWWDERRVASVEAPLALFFGGGTLYYRCEREVLV